MPTYRYYTCDVFANERFGGNQLAVLPDARGLSTEQMHAITREFNYSESTFVLPPESPEQTKRVRIFTPGGEVPFAGHPTVGTAHVLAAIGDVPLSGDLTRIVLGENVGPVPVTIRSANGAPVFCELSVAKLPEFQDAPVEQAVLAEVLSLPRADVLDGGWAPQLVSCGLPFTIVTLASRDAVRRAKLRMDAWETHLEGRTGEMIFLMAREGERPGSDIHARMFGPSVNVPEDPATGSACAALGGYLGVRDQRSSGTLRWVVEQGFEMGRPSILRVETDKANGAITAVRVGGSTVMVCAGEITV